jgi:hypothetical protein
MRKLKNVLAIIVLVLIASCKKEAESCEDVVCEDNATCVGGTCVCIEGYEGEGCATESREKFNGTWQGKDTCEITFPGNDQFSTTEIITYELIISDSAGNHFYVNMQIADEGGAGYSLYGTTHLNKLTIPNQFQTITLSDLPADIVGTVSGSGTISADQNSIALNLSVIGNVPIPNFGEVPANCECRGVLTK